MAYRIALIPGDGIGPEVTAAAQRVVDAAGVAVEWLPRHRRPDCARPGRHAACRPRRST